MLNSTRRLLDLAKELNILLHTIERTRSYIRNNFRDYRYVVAIAKYGLYKVFIVVV